MNKTRICISTEHESQNRWFNTRKIKNNYNYTKGKISPTNQIIQITNNKIRNYKHRENENAIILLNYWFRYWIWLILLEYKYLHNWHAAEFNWAADIAWFEAAVGLNVFDCPMPAIANKLCIDSGCNKPACNCAATEFADDSFCVPFIPILIIHSGIIYIQMWVSNSWV